MALSVSPFRRINFFNVFLVLGLLGGAFLMSYMIARSATSMGYLILGGIIGLALMVAGFLNEKFGFYVGILLGYLIPITERAIGGAISFDSYNFLFLYVCFGGLVYRKHIAGEPFFKGMAHPINYAFLLYFIYLMLEIFNPESFSPRGIAYYLMYTFHHAFIFLIAQHMFRDYKSIHSFLLFWIIAAAGCGAYACYQQWVGFMQFEMDWIHLSQKRVDIYMLDDGSLRKFGTMTDPAAFGILMSVSSLLTVIMLLKTPVKRTRIVLSVALLFQLLGMSYSGTRTATFAFIAGLCLYILMTLDNMRTLLFAVFFAFVLLFILYAPIYGNITINRLRSTFKFSDDRSFEVRDNNRSRVQPYILSHPIGGGPLTTGAAGENNSPNHPMAGFPVDSGLLRTALEFGWIGLTLLCGLYFVFLQQGVHYFYRIKNGLGKAILIAGVVTLFGNIVAQFSQVAIGPLPLLFLYFSLIASIIGVSKLENQKT